MPAVVPPSNGGLHCGWLAVFGGLTVLGSRPAVQRLHCGQFAYVCMDGPPVQASPPAANWLDRQLARNPNAGGIPRAVRRSRSLIDFAEYGLTDEPGQVANLNYWAYWVGEVPTVERDDSFMPARLGPWHGDRVMRHLASRLDAEDGVADLGMHTFSALIAARLRLLGEDPVLTAELADTAGRLVDGGRMPSSARQALAQVCYALRLHTR